ncbi:MAG: siderophore-interacting protein [Roseibium sp.]|uniref:siderophore-interacting protein n=1 Tax=Roseibium sp. TaxID=1936156 RepID=UPI002618D6F4|nr:siderophore-interacting protein [Roseibium sp.]MCV0427604.1 siderophore-interacting protein [Roseibium sp.]
MSNQTLSSSTYVPFAGADEAFAQLVAHAEEHDAVLETSGPGDARIVVGDNSIQITSNGKGLSFKVAAVSESLLCILKEASVLHLKDLNATAAEALRWKDAGVDNIGEGRPANFQELVLVDRSEPLSGLLRLQFESLGEIERLKGPGIHVKLLCPAVAGRIPVWPTTAANGTTTWPVGEDALHARYYTIRSVNLDTGTVDFDIVRHPGGVISDWAEKARPGDRIGLLGPGGHERPSEGDRIFLAGDQTALPALARMLEDLPANTSGHVIGEAETLDELRSYLPETDLTLHALPHACFSDEILNLARQQTGKDTTQFAWFAGEYKNAQEMRKLFKSEWGLSKGRQFSITYWRKGKVHKAN